MEFNDHKDIIVTYHGKFMETSKEFETIGTRNLPLQSLHTIQSR